MYKVENLNVAYSKIRGSKYQWTMNLEELNFIIVIVIIIIFMYDVGMCV